MSVKAEHTGFKTGDIERAFAEKLTRRGAAGFAGRRSGLAAQETAAHLKKRMENGLAARIHIRCGGAFIKRIQNGSGALFAARVLERRPSFEADGFHGTPLVHKKQSSFHTDVNNVQKVFLQFRATWNHSIMSEQKRLIFQNTLTQSIAERLTRHLQPVKVWHGQLPVEKELTVFRNIAAIFVNRGSRPDLAKKAERDLVRTISREFYENVPAGRAKDIPLYNKKNAQEESVTTRRTVTTLEEQIRQQKTQLAELTRKIETTMKPPEWDVGKLTGEVMRRMEREMHVERLRRGL